MKVGFIVGTLGRGGAERQLLYMLRALKNLGIAVRILCLTENEAYHSRIAAEGIRVDWVGANENRWIRLWTIIKNLRGDPVDVLQSSHFYTNIYAGLAGKFLSWPSIGAVRSDFTSEIKLHGFLGKWQVSLPSFLIVNSELALHQAIENGISPKKIEFVRNVVGTDRPGPEKKTNGNQIKLIFAGRLDEFKRPDRFIRLAAHLTEKYPSFRLKFQIAGGGPLRSELEELVRKLGLSSDKLEFLGICEDMNPIYRQADILISTSVREGTSNVILEAMAHGLPVVATDTGGTPDILTKERGIIIRPDNEEDLINASVRLLSDDKLRREMGENGREYVKRYHSLKSLEEQLSGIYHRLV